MRHNQTCLRECDMKCIYKCVDMVFILGVIINGIVVWRTIADRSLRTPTFIAIACLAFSDAMCLLLNSLDSFSSIYSAVTCSETSGKKGTHNIIKTILGIMWFASNGHVSVIAVVRCVLVIRPLHANVYLTKRKILIASGVVWLIGICIWGTVFVLDVVSMRVALNSVEFQLSLWSLVFFLSSGYHNHSPSYEMLPCTSIYTKTTLNNGLSFKDIQKDVEDDFVGDSFSCSIATSNVRHECASNFASQAHFCPCRRGCIIYVFVK